MRFDQWLVKNKEIRSRSQAEDLIKRGDVQIFDKLKNEWRTVKKTSYDVPDDFDPTSVRIQSDISEFVSRAGYKLKKALEVTGFDVEGKSCLDVGQSTGGFSQVLIQNKARVVVGLDVGSNQLSESLRHHENLFSFEGLDIRKAKNTEDFMRFSPFDFGVVDVSFISLTQILDEVEPLISKSGHVLALVKPQFELSRDDLDKKGRVKQEGKLLDVKAKILNFLKSQGKFEVEDYFLSALEGKEGNKEYFVFLKRKL